MLICPSGETPRRFLWSSTITTVKLACLSWKYLLKEKKCGIGQYEKFVLKKLTFVVRNLGSGYIQYVFNGLYLILDLHNDTV